MFSMATVASAVRLSVTPQYKPVFELDLPEWRGGKTKVFADVINLDRTGDFSKMTVLWDFSIKHVAGGKEIHSAKHFLEFNCKQDSVRMTKAQTYSGKMATGVIQWEEPNEDANWMKAEAQYMRELVNVACVMEIPSRKIR